MRSLLHFCGVLRNLLLIALMGGIAGCGGEDEKRSPPSPSETIIALTRLGVTNWLVQYGETTVLFDAYFKRPEPESEFNELGMDIFRDILAAKSVGSIDYIFVGHSHYDHVIDAAPGA